MKHISIIQGVDCHFELLGSIIDTLKSNYTINLILSHMVISKPEYLKWKHAYNHFFGFYSAEFIYTNINSIPKSEFVIIPTDNDAWANQIYNYFFYNFPLIILSHVSTSRFNLENVNKSTVKYIINVIGVPKDDVSNLNICNVGERNDKGENNKNINNDIGWSCVWEAITPQYKLSYLSIRPSLCIIGDQCLNDDSFFTTLMNSISNINDIDIFIINRKVRSSLTDLYMEKRPNIHFLINIDTIAMLYILASSHYVYFNTELGFTNEKRLSGQVPLSLSFLNRLIIPFIRKDQFNFKTALLLDPQSSIELLPLSEKDIDMLSKERDYFLEHQKQVFKRFEWLLEFK